MLKFMIGNSWLGLWHSIYGAVGLDTEK